MKRIKKPNKKSSKRFKLVAIGLIIVLLLFVLGFIGYKKIIVGKAIQSSPYSVGLIDDSNGAYYRCNDVDNEFGINGIYKFGTVTGLTGTVGRAEIYSAQDQCMVYGSSQYVRERWCASGNCATVWNTESPSSLACYQDFLCTYGCSDGKCNCPPGCDPNTYVKTCYTNSQIRECIDLNGCHTSVLHLCGTGRTCKVVDSQADCVCATDCVKGSFRCNGANKEICVEDLSVPGCNKWTTQETCSPYCNICTTADLNIANKRCTNGMSANPYIKQALQQCQNTGNYPGCGGLEWVNISQCLLFSAGGGGCFEDGIYSKCIRRGSGCVDEDAAGNPSGNNPYISSRVNILDSSGALLCPACIYPDTCNGIDSIYEMACMTQNLADGTQITRLSINFNNCRIRGNSLTKCGGHACMEKTCTVDSDCSQFWQNAVCFKGYCKMPCTTNSDCIPFEAACVPLIKYPDLSYCTRVICPESPCPSGTTCVGKYCLVV